MPSSDEDLELSPSAELFAGFVERAESGVDEDFEAFCARHQEHAEALRRLHAGWKFLGGALEDEWTAGAREPLAEELDEALARLRRDGAGSARIEVIAELARGGRGRIFRILDRDLGRELAMKTLRLDGTATHLVRSDARAVARFLDEARVTGALEHPGIVPVHEIGLDASGRLYFTMPLIRGESFDRVAVRVRDGELVLSRAIDILLRVCDAVSFAHSRGVVHRDLKPANVMVGPFGETYVIDWGLARFDRTSGLPVGTGATSESEESPMQTLVGDVLGTPAYMSPEQARGETDAIGPTTDVYALGAMLYELLAGAPPYPAGDSTPREIVERVRRDRPEPVAEVARDAPAELVAICERAMSRQPADRYGSVEALAEDLRAFQDQRVVRAYETGAAAELKKWVRRNWGLAATFAALAAVVTLGLVVSTVLYLVARERGRNVFRLSAIQDVRALVEEAEGLWPPHVDLLPSMQDWTLRAEQLVASLPEHRARLEEIGRRTGVQVEEGAEAEVAPAFPRTPEGWWQSQVLQLVRELESLRDEVLRGEGVGPAGWSLEQRMRLASEFAAASVESEEAHRRWADAAQIARERYAGLELKPQFGLVPIGPDPESGCLEFFVLGSGEEPRRDAAGVLEVEEQTGLVLVLLPASSGWMGAQSDDPAAPGYYRFATEPEFPPHQVELDPVLLGKFEVTQAQWVRVMGSNPSQLEAGEEMPSGRLTTARHPVESVTWSDAVEYTRRLGLSLPTEAQWELACRAGSTTPWFTGAAIGTLAGYANIADEGSSAYWSEGWIAVEGLVDGYEMTAPVGSYAPNSLGLHDMIGNVMEWVRDGTASYATYSPRPGDGLRREGAGHPAVLYRGGHFDSMENATRSSYRGYAPSQFLADSLGFRVARELR